MEFALKPCWKASARRTFKKTVVISNSGDPTLLGRRKELGIKDKAVSRAHCQLTVTHAAGLVLDALAVVHHLQCGSQVARRLRRGTRQQLLGGDRIYLLKEGQTLLYGFKVLAREQRHQGTEPTACQAHAASVGLGAAAGTAKEGSARSCHATQQQQQREQQQQHPQEDPGPQLFAASAAPGAEPGGAIAEALPPGQAAGPPTSPGAPPLPLSLPLSPAPSPAIAVIDLTLEDVVDLTCSQQPQQPQAHRAEQPQQAPQALDWEEMLGTLGSEVQCIAETGPQAQRGAAGVPSGGGVGRGSDAQLADEMQWEAYGEAEGRCMAGSGLAARGGERCQESDQEVALQLQNELWLEESMRQLAGTAAGAGISSTGNAGSALQLQLDAQLAQQLEERLRESDAKAARYHAFEAMRFMGLLESGFRPQEVTSGQLSAALAGLLHPPPLPPRPGFENPQRFSILTYNVMAGPPALPERMMAISAIILSLGCPDFILLQEGGGGCGCSHLMSAPWWSNYESSGFGPDTVLLARKDTVRGIRFLGGRELGITAGGSLKVALCELAGGVPLCVADAHLSCGTTPLDSKKVREAQMKEILEQLEGLDVANTFFGGDFNWRHDYSAPKKVAALGDYVWSLWNDAWEQWHGRGGSGGGGFTYDTTKMTMKGKGKYQERLDRLLYKSPDFALERLQIVGQEEIPAHTIVSKLSSWRAHVLARKAGKRVPAPAAGAFGAAQGPEAQVAGAEVAQGSIGRRSGGGKLAIFPSDHFGVYSVFVRREKRE